MARTVPAPPSRADQLVVPKVVFLFKLVPGLADRSFGLNVARLAHMPESAVLRAAVKAAEMEAQTAARAR